MSTAPKLTSWFPPSIKPVHVGMYKTHLWGKSAWCYWSGGWGWASKNFALANKSRGHVGAVQNKTWRGLASNPKEKL